MIQRKLRKGLPEGRLRPLTNGRRELRLSPSGSRDTDDVERVVAYRTIDVIEARTDYRRHTI